MSTEIFDKASLDALIDAVIVFALSLVTQLVALGGIPSGTELYVAGLSAFLAFLVFYAKKRGVESVKTS